MIKKLLKKIKSKFIVKKLVPVATTVCEGTMLQNKVAFISGGSGGIGYAIAERFVANGCKVIISGTNEDRLRNACLKLGSVCDYIVLNIAQPESIERLINDYCEKHQEVKFDILVNCAGVHGPAQFLKTTVEDWDSVMNVNLRGMYFLSQWFAQYFIQENIKGHILNVGSASALKPGRTPYEISKAGVETLTRGMAFELIPYNIIVNCISPGPTATKMLNMDGNTSLNWSGNPSGRVATPEEIANWAVFLASGIGDYVVGTSVYVTGGSGTICIDK